MANAEVLFAGSAATAGTSSSDFEALSDKACVGRAPLASEGADRAGVRLGRSRGVPCGDVSATDSEAPSLATESSLLGDKALAHLLAPFVVAVADKSGLTTGVGVAAFEAGL